MGQEAPARSPAWEKPPAKPGATARKYDTPVPEGVHLKLVEGRPVITPELLRSRGFLAQKGSAMTSYVRHNVTVGDLCAALGIEFPAPFRGELTLYNGGADAEDQMHVEFFLALGDWRCEFTPRHSQGELGPDGTPDVYQDKGIEGMAWLFPVQPGKPVPTPPPNPPPPEPDGGPKPEAP
jgi:hypothetical protein